jgi:hypothetical protein
VQSEFSNLLLSQEFSSDLDMAITKVLSLFLREVFHWRVGSQMPELEDIFTCIDLSANTGHHLGIKYTPKLLRAIRRMMIYRIFSVLDQRFAISPHIQELLRHTKEQGLNSSSFVVLNWDIVLEKHLARLGIDVDYGCDSLDWNRPLGERTTKPPTVPVCKMHGSGNWVYCENCKALFYDLNEKLALRSKVGLIKHDFRLFDEKFSGKQFNEMLGIDINVRKCHRCKNMVSSHIATFSYRKSFRTYAYSAIWHRAEDLLAEANHWVFIGYSLPKADFELKSLLKTAQLRYAHLPRRGPVRIDVVVKGDAARRDYEAFFGPDRFQYFDQGLENYVTGLDRRGALSTSCEPFTVATPSS